MNTIEQTYVSGIVCNKCHHTLRCHTMDEHLDINHPVHQCPSHDDVLLNENQKHRDNALDKNKEIMQSANVNRDNHEEDEEYEEDEEIDQRRKWVEDYNNSLPQVKHYMEEFETELIVAVGGIYDSEYMNYVFDNIESKRIKDTKDLLIENQKRRENALDKYREFIDGMIEDVNGKRPKNIRYRKWLRNRLRYGAMTVFKTEEEEYQFIGKYGRGMWDMVYTAFKKQDQNIMTEFAYEYGAFDY